MPKVSRSSQRSFAPRGDEMAWRAEQSKGFNQPQPFRMATDDFGQQKISERWPATGFKGVTDGSRCSRGDDATITNTESGSGGLISKTIG
jgi:hypothetical protein